jgi:hypothetical protein
MATALPQSVVEAKQRRKLQKPPMTKRRNSWFLGRKSRTSLDLLPPSQDSFAVPQGSTPRLALPPDLSDSKWSDFLKKSSRANSKRPTPLASPTVEKNVSIVPEFAHLSVQNVQDNRPSVSSNYSATSDETTASAVARRRRQAKTPVHSIGQLERLKDHTPPMPQPRPHLDARRDSALILGQEYRDLLASRNSDATERQSLHYSSSDDSMAGMPGYISPSAIGSNNPSEPGSSPTTSTSGRTLFGYQPEAVFFKPYDFPREDARSVALSGTESRAPFTQSQMSLGNGPDNLSLQLCLELLTRELSTALGSHSQRTGSSTSALQVLMMIEAYERLRNQIVAEAERQPFGRGVEEARQMEAMFDMWLKSLYTVHDRLMGEARSRLSESDYGAFEMEHLH